MTVITKAELETRLLRLETSLHQQDEAYSATADHFLYKAVIELLNLVGHVHDKACAGVVEVERD